MENEKLENLKVKMENNTAELDESHGVLTKKDLKEIEKMIKNDQYIHYKRMAGHFHKQDDILENVVEQLDDLKIFIKHVIKNDS